MPAGVRRREGPAPAQTVRRRIAQTALLACGVVAPLVYVATDVIAGLRWEGYSFRDQTISELNAIGAPTRSLTIALGLVGYAFLTAFGVGVWRSAGGRRRLRVAGGALAAFGVTALWAVPFASMHVREAEESLSDLLHGVSGGVAGLLLLVVIGFGAGAFGTRYRVYSIATVLLAYGLSIWSATAATEVADNVATPWLGVEERVGIFAYQLWLVVFAVALLARHLRSSVERGGRDEMPASSSAPVAARLRPANPDPRER